MSNIDVTVSLPAPIQLSLKLTGGSNIDMGSVIGGGISGDFLYIDSNGSLAQTNTPTFATVTAPTFTGSLVGNASTATSAAKWTTPRNLAGNSVDGSANVAFANKFVVQGTADDGLSAAQFLGALGTGIVKNTTATGVLSIAIAADFPTLNQNTTGSAATLATPRAINGVSFDGSVPITITAAAGTLTGTVLNSTVVTSSLTSVDTIATGVWKGTPIAIANGGTGNTSYTDGQILIGNTVGNTLVKTTLAGTSNQVIVTNGNGTITLSTPQSIGTVSSPTFTGLTLSGLTAGSALFVGTSGVISQDNANFFWDVTNHRLGIGTTPSAKLHVLATTEQLRLGYDASNYISNTVSSTGGLTMASTGTNGGFTFTPSGTGSLILNSGNTTGTNVTSSFLIQGNSLTTGNGLYITSSSITTASLAKIVNASSAATGGGTTLEVKQTGSTSTASAATYGLYATNDRTGTTITNVAAYLSATGGTNNYGLIVANGSVGIGTTSPGAALDVRVSDAGVGNATLAGIFGRTGAASSATAREAGIAFSDANNQTLTAGITGIRENSSGNYLGGLGFYVHGTSTPGAAAISDLTRAMTILSGGNVGIGTTSPGETLQVSGSAYVTSRLAVGQDTGGSLANIAGASTGTTALLGVGIQGITNGFTVNTDASNNITYSFLNKNQAQGLYQDTNANVGIGTTTPTGIGSGYRNLVIQGNGSSAAGGSIYLTDSTSTAIGTISTDQSANALYIDTRSTGTPIIFRPQGASEVTRITNAGTVGIGTGATVSAKLHVLATTEQLRLGYDTSNYASFTTDSTGSLTIAPTGTNPNITITPGGAGHIILSGSPTTTTQSPADNSTKVATTAYVDNAVLGQDFKEAVKYATTAALPSIVYANGSSGVGATLTGVALAAISVDGASPSVADRILVKNQASTFQNGIYTVTATGSGIAVFVLTRATDFDQSTDIKTGDSAFVTVGTANSTTTWAVNSADSPVMGTDAITFAQVAGQGSFTAGNGIAITGNSIAIDTSITVDKTTVQTLTNKTLTSPILTTPTLGVASATTINKVTITAPATGSTLTIADGKILVVNNILTLAGTDSTTMTFPSTSATIARTDAGNTFTGNQSVVGQYRATQFTCTVTLDWNNGNVQNIQLASGNNTFTFANPLAGGRYMIILRQPASGAAGTVTWPTVLWSGATAPVLTATNSKTDVITFVYDGTNTSYMGGFSLNY